MEDTREEQKRFDTEEEDTELQELLKALDGIARSDEKMRQRILAHKNIQ